MWSGERKQGTAIGRKKVKNEKGRWLWACAFSTPLERGVQATSPMHVHK